jgi:hypothetical protein
MYAAGDAQEFLRGHVDKLDLQIKRARDKLANDQSGRLTLSKETQAQATKKTQNTVTFILQMYHGTLSKEKPRLSLTKKKLKVLSV